MFGSVGSAAPQGARLPLIAANWKMHETYSEGVKLAQGVVDRLERAWRRRCDVVMCPPFTVLRGVSNVIAFDKSWAQVGAQDCYWEPDGAFTGEISIAMLKDLDCAFCIVGHSERRAHFGETDEVVARKVAALLAQGVTPIVCVGEPREVYDAGDTVEHVVAQVRGALTGEAVQLVGPMGLVVAYEPVWAIGSGQVPTPEHAQQVAAAIRGTLAELVGAPAAQASRVLYGGSVKAGNVAAFTGQPDVDGALVGGASLDAASFVDIVKGVLGADA